MENELDEYDYHEIKDVLEREIHRLENMHVDSRFKTAHEFEIKRLRKILIKVESIVYGQ